MHAWFCQKHCCLLGIFELTSIFYHNRHHLKSWDLHKALMIWVVLASLCHTRQKIDPWVLRLKLHSWTSSPCIRGKNTMRCFSIREKKHRVLNAASLDGWMSISRRKGGKDTIEICRLTKCHSNGDIQTLNLLEDQSLGNSSAVDPIHLTSMHRMV